MLFSWNVLPDTPPRVSAPFRPMNSSGPEPMHFHNYITRIKNSCGARLWRNAWISKNGQKIDATENGGISCAYFVSDIILATGYIKSIHLTVNSTVKDLEGCAWRRIPKNKPRVGCVIVWEPETHASGRTTGHIGFYIGNGRAISHRDDTRCPRIHDWKYRNEPGRTEPRGIQALYWHPWWDKCQGRI